MGPSFMKTSSCSPPNGLFFCQGLSPFPYQHEIETLPLPSSSSPCLQYLNGDPIKHQNTGIFSRAQCVLQGSGPWLVITEEFYAVYRPVNCPSPLAKKWLKINASMGHYAVLDNSWLDASGLSSVEKLWRTAWRGQVTHPHRCGH